MHGNWLASLRENPFPAKGEMSVAYESTFGSLDTSAARHAPGTAETPFRVAVWGDFSGRSGREAAAAGDVLRDRKPLKITHDTLDEVLESIAPRLSFNVANGDVAVELEFSELDDFHPDAVARQVDRVSDLDNDAATGLMREILHHPLYQSLESCWRGVDWLLRRRRKTIACKSCCSTSRPRNSPPTSWRATI